MSIACLPCWEAVLNVPSHRQAVAKLVGVDSWVQVRKGALDLRKGSRQRVPVVKDLPGDVEYELSLGSGINNSELFVNPPKDFFFFLTW